MAETKSGYKLIHLKFNKAKGLTPSFGYYFQKWLERLAECENITLDSHAQPSVSNNYYAYLNGGALTGFIRSSEGCRFGTSKAGGSSYLHTGLSMLMIASGADYYPQTMIEARIITDEANNLIYGSAFNLPSKDINGNYGFLFTNDGIMNTAESAIYSMGENPAQIATCGFRTTDIANGIRTQMNAADLQIYRSKAFLTYTEDDTVGIRDHVEYVFSKAQNVRATSIANTAYEDVFEQITIDGQKYLHLGGYIWIPFDEEETEEIEVSIG